jgi:hypothetical protein
MMMELTPEQRNEIRAAKSAGHRRTTIRFTTQQKAEWEAAVQEELAGKEENIAHHQKIKAAAEQPGFFGDLRRSIALSRMSMEELSSEIGVDQRLLSDFRTDDAELPAVTLDRLIQTLGLRLMHEIPR